MAQQSFVLTALPNGYSDDGKQLRLSVFLSPRLDCESDPKRLDSFADWLDWPNSLAKGSLKVSYNHKSVSVAMGGGGSTDRLDPTLGMPDSAVWRALFRADLGVRSYSFTDYSKHTIKTFDATDLGNRVASLYGDLAAKAGDNLPPVSDFVDSRDWGEWMTAVFLLDEIDGDIPGPDSRELNFALQQFSDFHTPLAPAARRQVTRTDDPRIKAAWNEYVSPPMPKPDELAQQLEFHQIVASMGSYPTLLRKLGLVVDLLLSNDFKASNEADLSVQLVFPKGALATHVAGHAAPVTRTLLSAKSFEATSDPGAKYLVKDGLLDLDAKRFTLLQADIDSAGLKAMNFARSLLRRTDPDARVDPVTRQEDAIGAPALRTAGLMLVERERGDWLSSRLAANKDRNASLENQIGGSKSDRVPLHAEDLVRGYRFDIWDATTGAWASLCRRTATYSLGDGKVTVQPAAGEEESTIRLAATTPPDPASTTKVLSLHEALMTWHGWSLAAPLPGQAILPNDAVDQAPDGTQADVPPGVQLTSRFKAVKASLPRLRFGRRYWIRARAVDLAGNSLPFRTGDFGSEQPDAHAQTYLRFEPVAAPVVGLLSDGGAVEAPAEGESMNCMAIRSFNDTPADSDTPSAQQAHRAALPPRVSARDVEHHGMLDHAGRVDPSTFTMLAHDKDRDAQDPDAVLREVTLPMQGPLGGSPSDTTFAVYEDGRAMTYLPDPYAGTVAVRIFSHPNIADDEIILVPFYPGGAWPEAQPFVIEVFDGGAAKPWFDAASRRLRVPLPKGVRARIRLSSTLDDASLANMGIFGWLKAFDQNAQRTRALNGQHWMLTPARELTIVHAVQRPLVAPDISLLQIMKRDLGSTSVRPMMLVNCSLATTDRLDLLARWHEPSDDGAAPGDRQRDDVAFSVKITDSTDYANVQDGNPGGGHPEHSIAGADLVGINALLKGILPKSHEFHDTRYRRIEYAFDATTRFREFMPAAILTGQDDSGATTTTDEHIKVSGSSSVRWIPNSAPPPVPSYLYAVPTFGWRRDEDTDGHAVSERRGGIRVYLDRPWNVSGYGEMLAVVLPPADFTGDPESEPNGHPLKRYATLWGNDPVWDSALVAGIGPRRGDFPLARFAPDASGKWLPPGAPATEADQRPGTFKATGFNPPGVPAGTLKLEVAPHDVFWDADRQLWHCDIEIAATGSYFPLIRLALARYQPISADEAWLSGIVLADFLALAPGRWVAIAATEPRQWQVTVSGTGYASSSGWQEAKSESAAADVVPAKTSVIEVWVERLEPRLGDDFGWQLLTGAVVTPGAGAAATGAPAQVLWNGQVSVPEKDACGHLRLVVAEYEEYVVDGANPYGKVPTRKGRRIVFVEHHALKL
ncbi:hypothetical protein AB3X94_29845 [Paraburkholderia sp. BR10923]|uniref:Uncharacterized protein n=1 Tax=Paraburkholderia youngii TaxID=2782701 RepID=A0A7Y6JXK0_9BURK|nr:hypothetical protein [Paraburkholderia youngii]NUX99774.1 hypothetical protein [Paraburkholderia youngii]